MKRERGGLADKVSVESLTVAIIKAISENLTLKFTQERILEIVDDLMSSDLPSERKLELYNDLMDAHKGDTDYIQIVESEVSEHLYNKIKQNRNVKERHSGSTTYLSMKIAKDT